MSIDSGIKSFLFGSRMSYGCVLIFVFIWLVLSLFVKGIAGKGMVMPGDKAPLVSLSFDITNKGD